jgi:hypothetical protein
LSADGSLTILIEGLGDHLSEVQGRQRIAEQLRNAGFMRPEDISPDEDPRPDATKLAAKCGILVGQALVLIVASLAVAGVISFLVTHPSMLGDADSDSAAQSSAPQQARWVLANC